MKKSLFIIALLAMTACQQPTSQDGNNTGANSTYSEYVKVYNAYIANRQERPTFTKKFMDKELDSKAFKEALDQNEKEGRILKDIAMKYFQLYELEVGKEEAAKKQLEL